jgi:sugar lactone lactonase YvrE
MRKFTVLFSMAFVILTSGMITTAYSEYFSMEVTDLQDLPEGIAIDKTGNIYVGMAMTGNIIKITPNGVQTTFADLDNGFGFLTGLAVDASGNVYAALASFNPATHGVWRIDQKGNSEIFASLPVPGIPNGLAFDKRGNLFVTDSLSATIWRISSQGEVEQWLSDQLLEGITPPPGFTIGANGISLDKDGSLFVANTEKGIIVRIPVYPNGNPGTPEIFLEDEILVGADGIAFDNHRNLYVAVNSQNIILRISPQGEITIVADQEETLDFPASLAFGTGKSDRKNLFYTNFAFNPSPGENRPGPSLWKVDVQVPGRPLP